MPKNVFTVMFCNKGMERLSLNRILKSEESITLFPGKICKDCYISKILNEIG